MCRILITLLYILNYDALHPCFALHGGVDIIEPFSIFEINMNQKNEGLRHVFGNA